MNMSRLRPLLNSDMLSTSSLIAPPRLRRYTADNLMTIDRAMMDSAGAFFVGQLERLDPTMHDPLVSVFWNRDIDLREDVTLGDELSSFTINSFAAPGGVTPGGKAWIGKDTNAIASIALDIGKLAQPLHLWGMEMAYTIPELASAQQLGRPIDVSKYNGIKLKHQMDIDEQVYIGDAQLGTYGLLTSPVIFATNAPVGVSGSATWANKTPDEILADLNATLTGAWSATGWAVAPTHVLLPPVKFSYLVQNKVSSAGNNSILTYLQENNISTKTNNTPITIAASKWCVGRGAGGTDRMVAYTKNKEYVRFPMTPLARTAPEIRSIYTITTYYCRMGSVEFVYPETMTYLDGF